MGHNGTGSKTCPLLKKSREKTRCSYLESNSRLSLQLLFFFIFVKRIFAQKKKDTARGSGNGSRIEKTVIPHKSINRVAKSEWGPKSDAILEVGAHN